MSQFFSPTSFAAGVLVGAVLGYVALAGTGSFMGLLPTPNASTTNIGLPTSNTSGAVSIVNQNAGDLVTVESVTVPPPGVWVAVRDVIGTDLGNVLGAARVSGPQTSVSIPLLRATEPGTHYAIQLYRDNGDGVFDLSSDSVYVDLDTGERVVAYFNTAP